MSKKVKDNDPLNTLFGSAEMRDLLTNAVARASGSLHDLLAARTGAADVKTLLSLLEARPALAKLSRDGYVHKVDSAIGHLVDRIAEMHKP